MTTRQLPAQDPGLIRDRTLDEPFVAFVQRRLRAEQPPTMDQLLLLGQLKRRLELDLSVSPSSWASRPWDGF
jgi:hypothetical protein